MGFAPRTSMAPRLRMSGEITSPGCSTYALATLSPSCPKDRDRPPITLPWR